MGEHCASALKRRWCALRAQGRVTGYGMRSEELGEEGERGDAYGVGAGKAVGGDVRGVEDDLEDVDWTMPK